MAIPKSCLLLLKAAALLLGMCLLAKGELTPQEVSTGLGNPSGGVWQLTGPATAAWVVDSVGLTLANPPAEAVAIEATLSGPGVMSLEARHNSGAFRVSVLVDGLVSGNRHDGTSMVHRATVVAGEHRVRWVFERSASNTGSKPLAVGPASWEPFSELPLSAGVTGNGVLLNTTGNRPWIGQSAWNHGDGGAAWSGLRGYDPTTADTLPGEPLNATFQGPGVVDFWFRGRGEGYAKFQLDGQSAETVASSSVVPAGSWQNRWLSVGPGSHTLAWETGVYVQPTLRWTYDLAVDEVRLRAAVPLDEALDTPGWNWSPLAGAEGRAVGVAEATAVGGALAKILPGYGIRATVPAQRLLKIRSRGITPRPFFRTWLTELGSNPTAGSTDWVDSLWALEENATQLTIYGGAWDTEVDRVELMPLPTTLAASLGVVDLPVTSSGDGSWTAVPFAEIADHGARVVARRGEGDSWTEMPVTGPAAVEFSWKGTGYSDGTTVLVDGRAIEGLAGNSTRVRLEIPAGNHTLRWRVKAPAATDPWPQFGMIVGGVRVSPLPAGGLAMAALQRQEPVSVPAGWMPSAGPGADGDRVLQSPVSTPAQFNQWTGSLIRTNFQGPGEVGFRWYGRPAGDGGSAVRWLFRSTGANTVFYDPGDAVGWSEHRVWVPPGETLFEWEAHFRYGLEVSAALGQVTFTPSPVLAIGEALGAPELEWKNDSANPWLPLALPGEDGNTLVSPNLASGESATFSTVVKGPGKISFCWDSVVRLGGVQCKFMVDGKEVQSSGDYPNGDLVEVNIPVSSAVTLGWTVAPSYIGYEGKALIGVNHVKWQPAGEVPLAAALDAPPEVSWSTSTEIPFTGREAPGATGGSLAYIGLSPGEESWLEATVNGPGLFDFWIRQIADMNLSPNPWNHWSLTIDGQAIDVHGTTWQPRWISGAGPHKIRFTFFNPDHEWSEWLVSGLDAVSWVPVAPVSLATAAGSPGLIWQTGATLPAEGFSTAGRDGGPAIVIRADVSGDSWLGTVVKGPCDLSWNSRLENPADGTRQFLELDGVEVLPIEPHPWTRMRLSLPAGPHSIRWVSRLAYEPYDGPQAVISWSLDQITVSPGVSPLAEALDSPELFALETGDAGGRRIEMAEDDAWEPGIGSTLVFFDPEKVGKITTVWGRSDSASARLRYGPAYAERWLSTTGGWHTHVAVLQPGELQQWNYHGTTGSEELAAPLLRNVVFAGQYPQEPGAAMEAPPLSGGGWIGLGSGEAVTGGNAAWSLLNLPNGRRVASTTLTGPARVSFWWRITGPGKLTFSLDGGNLPVASAAAAWSKVEFEIGSGPHGLSWIHAQGKGIGFSTPGEAWLDGLETSPINPNSLTEAGTRDGSPALASVPAGDLVHSTPWRPAAFLGADGSWIQAARSVDGTSLLSTMVTGPAILRFRGRYFDGSGPALEPEVVGRGETGELIVDWSNPGGTVIINPDPFAYDRVLENFLAVCVGESNPLRIGLDASGAWRDAAVRIPSGTYEVTFQVQALLANWLGSTRISPGNLQGWIDDLRVVSPASHYTEWAVCENLPAEFSSKDTDADGDGFTNFLEYSFGTDPRDGSSKPRPLEMTKFSTRGNASSQGVRLPYLPSHSEGMLQSSKDLVHWQDESSIPLLHYPPEVSGGLFWPEPDLQYPFLKLPADARQKFYRIGIRDAE